MSMRCPNGAFRGGMVLLAVCGIVACSSNRRSLCTARLKQGPNAPDGARLPSSFGASLTDEAIEWFNASGVVREVRDCKVPGLTQRCTLSTSIKYKRTSLRRSARCFIHSRHPLSLPFSAIGRVWGSSARSYRPPCRCCVGYRRRRAMRRALAPLWLTRCAAPRRR